MILRLLAAPYRTVDRLLARRVPATGLALFRIAYAAVLLGEIAQLAFYRQLIFDDVLVLGWIAVDAAPVLLTWALAVLAVLLGWKTRAAAVVSYAATLSTLSTFRQFQYHYDYILIGTNFLLMWIPSGTAMSLDRWLAARRDGGRWPAPRVSVLCYGTLLVFEVGAVYLDSVCHKLTSPMWRAGLGVWLPASLPQLTWLDWSPVLDLQPLMLLLGYVTLVFEATFLLLFFRRRFRVPLVVVGVGLHLGICLAFPIPLFGLGMASFYLLLVPFGFWGSLARRRGRAPAAPKDANTVPALTAVRAARWRRIRVSAILAFYLTAGLFQLAATYRSPLFAAVWPRVERHVLGRAWHGLAGAMGLPARRYLGITPHGIFIDANLAGYEHIVALSYRHADGRETWLPLVSRRGQPVFPAWGRVWTYWSYRVNSPRIRRVALGRGIFDFTSFWAPRHGVSLESAEFRVYVKKVTVPAGWRRGFLRGQIARPWLAAGTARWRKGECEIDLADIETL